MVEAGFQQNRELYLELYSAGPENRCYMYFGIHWVFPNL
jgi:hypothetical protein